MFADYDGVSMSSRTPESKNAANEATNLFQSHYPEMLVCPTLSHRHILPTSCPPSILASPCLSLPLLASPCLSLPLLHPYSAPSHRTSFSSTFRMTHLSTVQEILHQRPHAHVMDILGIQTSHQRANAREDERRWPRE
jgi:hypothetical protein